jgi:hypothetical protein
MRKVQMLEKRWLVAVALAVVFGTALSAYALMPLDPEPFGGIWVETPTQDCDAGKICVVWEFSNGVLSSDPPCCVNAEYVASGEYAACSATFRHLH